MKVHFTVARYIARWRGTLHGTCNRIGKFFSCTLVSGENLFREINIPGPQPSGAPNPWGLSKYISTASGEALFCRPLRVFWALKNVAQNRCPRIQFVFQSRVGSSDFSTANNVRVLANKRMREHRDRWIFFGGASSTVFLYSSRLLQHTRKSVWDYESTKDWRADKKNAEIAVHRCVSLSQDILWEILENHGKDGYGAIQGRASDESFGNRKGQVIADGIEINKRGSDGWVGLDL